MAGRSKTKEKILKTALALLNNEGEPNITAVDIAAVMDISPGNLYYHYKGKDVIIELFADFEAELTQVLSATINSPMAVEDNWVYLYIIFEEINDFRFFYLNLTSLLERIPELRPKFMRLLALMKKTFERNLSVLETSGHLVFRTDEKDVLSERLTAHFTYWLPYANLRSLSSSPKTVINEGVYAALIQITPHWGDRADTYATLLKDFLDGQGG